MKTRILSAIVGLVILIIVMFSSEIVFGLAVFILSIIGINEIFNAFINKERKPIKVLGYISSLFIPILVFSEVFIKDQSILKFKIYCFFAFLIFLSGLFILVFKFEKYDYIDIALTYFGIIYVVFLFSFVVLTRNLENGKFYIWLVFIGAWLTDSAAYFTGVNLGKTKIIPVVSPKKTIEGSIGGVVGCIMIMLLYGMLIVNSVNEIAFYHYVILGTLCGIISQVGDWSASAIKRKVDVKDYGNLMPGHGGVIDRFDSILVIAPVVYFYMTIFVL